MSDATKPFSLYDQQQIFKKAYNPSGTLAVDGFLAGEVGRKITRALTTTNVLNDTEIFSYYENQTTLLFQLTVVYTDATRSDLLSVERTA